jgi:hypothetical protein
MKLNEIFSESASGGATSAGSIATAVGDQYGFGGDPSASIYAPIKKHRAARKVTKKLTEYKKEGVAIHKLDNIAKGTYIFIYNPEAGFFIKSCHGYASHSRLLEKIFDKYYKLAYDDWERGYVVVNPYIKTIIVMPTVRDFYLDEYEVFKKRFPSWTIDVKDHFERMLFYDELKKPAKISNSAYMSWQMPSRLGEGKKSAKKKPATLGGKDKVASDTILGAPEKKNPTLSNKFFGGCSRDNDPGNKSVLGETRSPDEQRLMDEIDKCYAIADDPKTPRDVAEDYLQAVGLLWAEAEEKGYLAAWQNRHQKELDAQGDNPDLLDIRDTLKGTVSHKKTPNKTDMRLFKKMGVDLGSDWPELPQPQQQSDEDFLKSMGIANESLTYKEFRNARNAESRVCPVCGSTFKNVHSADQQFCCQGCETKGTTMDKLQETFRNDLGSEAYKEGYKNGRADYRLKRKSEYAWHSGSDTGSEFRAEYSRGYRAGWLDGKNKHDQWE